MEISGNVFRVNRKFTKFAKMNLSQIKISQLKVFLRQKIKKIKELEKRLKHDNCPKFNII